MYEKKEQLWFFIKFNVVKDQHKNDFSKKLIYHENDFQLNFEDFFYDKLKKIWKTVRENIFQKNFQEKVFFENKNLPLEIHKKKLDNFRGNFDLICLCAGGILTGQRGSLHRAAFQRRPSAGRPDSGPAAAAAAGPAAGAHGDGDAVVVGCHRDAVAAELRSHRDCREHGTSRTGRADAAGRRPWTAGPACNQPAAASRSRMECTHTAAAAAFALWADQTASVLRRQVRWAFRWRRTARRTR